MSLLMIFNKLEYISKVLLSKSCVYTFHSNIVKDMSVQYFFSFYNVKNCFPFHLAKSCNFSNSICRSYFGMLNPSSSHLLDVKRYTDDSKSTEVKITYIDRDGINHDVKGCIGDNVMYLAQKHDLDIEGACEASLACCTCHVYVENYFDKLNDIEEEEEDMLDLAPFLQENSRLSCQIILSKELDGLIVRLPSATRNFYVDGHKPKPH